MKKIHLICNAHIDPVWQWEWEEGAAAALSTFRSAADLADRFDYIFCHNEVTLYKYIAEYDSVLFCRIKELVTAGKWHIMGGWYLQPDCNMPSGESFVRQVLCGNKYFMNNFGVKPTSAINFDPFGHSFGLVQILAKCGYDSYMVCRPLENELKLPDDYFIWQGPDGSKIKAARVTSFYNSSLGGAAEKIKKEAEREKNRDTAVILWGVGNHGGGPSAKDLSDIEILAKKSDYTLIHSTPENFFKEAKFKKIFSRSLNPSMPGCYTSMSIVKKLHRMLENQLFFTEKILSHACLAGFLSVYPQEELDEAVHDLLTGEFHDILPGTSVRAGEENAIRIMYHGLEILNRLRARAFFALSIKNAKANDGEYPIFVYNPHPYEIETAVECEFQLADQNFGDLVGIPQVYDSNETPLKTQLLKENSNLNLDWRKRIIFEGRLSPCGMNRFYVKINFTKKTVSNYSDNCDIIVSSEGKIVKIGKKSGLLESFIIEGKEYISGPAFEPILFSDNADPWAMSARQLKGIGKNPRRLKLLTEQSCAKFCGIKGKISPVRIIEDGQILTEVESFLGGGNTVVRLSYKIYKNLPYIDVNADVFFNEKDKFLKLKIPCGSGTNYFGQTAFAKEELIGDGRENVSQKYISVDCGGKYLAVINDCIYGSSYKGGALYLSLLRGTGYTVHPILNRPLLKENRYIQRIDQGERNFSFRIAAGDENCFDAQAQIFNEKPYALNIFPTGECENSNSGILKVSDNKIVLSALKKAETADGYIIRLYNPRPHSVKTIIECDKTTKNLEFEKWEAKTLLYNGNYITELTGMAI